MSTDHMKLLDDIIADLDMRARMDGQVEDGKAVLDLSNGLLRRYYALKEAKPAAPPSPADLQAAIMALSLPTPSWARDHHGENEVYIAQDLRNLLRDAAALVAATEASRTQVVAGDLKTRFIASITAATSLGENRVYDLADILLGHVAARQAKPLSEEMLDDIRFGIVMSAKIYPTRAEAMSIRLRDYERVILADKEAP